MKVLLFNAYYPPDRSASATMAAAAVEALEARGHDVRVVAGRPSYDTATTAWRPFVRNGPVLRVGSTAGSRTRMANRVSNYVTFTGLATPVAVTAGADVVVGMTDPPFAGMLAAAASRMRRRPFVYWIQDYHPAFALAAGIVADTGWVRWWSRLQQRTLRAADAVVVLGDDMAETVVRDGADRRRVHIIPNGTGWAPGRASPTTWPDLRTGLDFVVVHGGNIGHAGPWHSILGAAARLDPDRAGFVFVGDGAMRTKLERGAAGQRNVRFIDRLDPAGYAAVSRAADLQLVGVRRGLEGLLVPTKLYDALAVGRPILAVADDRSDVARLVRRHNCGLVADPDDPDSIVAAIRRARSDPDGLVTMAANAKRAAAGYERSDLMLRLADLIASVAGA